MKPLKLALTLAVTALVLSLAPAGHASTLVPDGTYVFTATDGDPNLNGSSVTFSGDTIVSWLMLDPLAPSYNPYPPTDIPLTPSNSSISAFGLFGPNQWYFIIDGQNFNGANYYDQFKGQNNLFGPGVGGGTGALYDGFGDPDGNWTLRVASTPDTGDTLWLFGTALIALGVCRLRLQFASR